MSKVATKVTKFGSHLKELRLHLCQTGKSSQGVRDFVSKYYADIKKINPELPILVRESAGIEPKLWLRYEYGRETSASLTDLNGDQVFQQIQSLATKK